MSVETNKTGFEATLAAEFAHHIAAVPGDWALRQRRRNAFKIFERLGLPTRRDEDWHYTDLRRLMPEPAMTMLDPMANATADGCDILTGVIGNHYRLQDGGSIEGGLPAGLEVYSLKSALRSRPELVTRLGSIVADEASAIVALNTAFFADATIIVVRAGAKIDKPLHANYLNQAGLPLRMDARLFIILEDGAELTFVHSVAGPDDANMQVNSVIELAIGTNAKLNYLRSNVGSLQSTTMQTIAARLESHAEMNLFTLNTGSNLSRTEVRVTFDGPHSKVGLRGVNLLRGQQHGDVTLMVDHRAPHCESRELFRHIVDDEATGVFQGKIMVKRQAQKTDGQMASNAILLSDDAVMNNKPELEIFADDVVCAHGATCGELDEDLLFYLQARGLPKNEAEALMIQAFCGEAIDFVDNEPLRDAYNDVVASWLATRAAA